MSLYAEKDSWLHAHRLICRNTQQPEYDGHKTLKGTDISMFLVPFAFRIRIFRVGMGQEHLNILANLLNVLPPSIIIISG